MILYGNRYYWKSTDSKYENKCHADDVQVQDEVNRYFYDEGLAGLRPPATRMRGYWERKKKGNGLGASRGPCAHRFIGLGLPNLRLDSSIFP
jgi:hypothetical protein